ncbi:hypothetical protein evm_006521 [Chilo suppressalis]|nr:hypothetical protein evm_006521 [Chilo suppressalis]
MSKENSFSENKIKIEAHKPNTDNSAPKQLISGYSNTWHLTSLKFVTIMFWTLYTIDRELVFPEIFDTIVPWWFNHCVHTNIAIILVVETLLTPRRHPTNKGLELKISTLVTFGYAVVYYSIYFFTNRWLYNIFGIMTWWQVCLYQIGIWSSTYVFYFMHFPINRLIHGQEEKSVETNKVQPSNGTQKSVEIATIQKKSADDAFSSDNWHLKYRSLREKFENSRL